MRQIIKNKEPQSLTEHRAKEYADYDNYEEKDDLRKSLCIEQRGICCYCMESISPDVKYMKIEHFHCQEDYPKQQLDYRNLLGACKGNEGQPPKFQHCDTHKGRKVLNFYPPNQVIAIQNLIQYGNDGSINSTNSELDRELNEVLNLNVIQLKNKRKAALDGFKLALNKYKGSIKKPTLERWLAIWNGEQSQDALKPYCQVIVYWLKKKIAQT